MPQGLPATSEEETQTNTETAVSAKSLVKRDAKTREPLFETSVQTTESDTGYISYIIHIGCTA